jgi:hypothetical protein
VEIEFIDDGSVVVISKITDRRGELQIPAWAPESDMALKEGDDGEVVRVDRVKSLVLVKWYKGGVFPAGSLQDTWWVRPAILDIRDDGEDLVVKKLGFDFNRFIFDEFKKLPANFRDTARRKIQETIAKELAIMIKENTNITGRLKF